MLGVIATSLKENIYQAEAKLKFKGNTVTSSLTDVGKAIGGFSPIADRGNPIATEAEVLRSVPLIKETIEDPQLNLKSADGQKLSVNAFSRKLKVGSLPSTDILKVSYSSEDPEQAAKIVNTLVRNYLQNNQIVNTAEAVSAREFLEVQLPKVEESLRKTEAAIRQLKESNEFVAPAEDTKALITSQKDLEDQIVKTRGELANAESQANYIREKLGLSTQEAFILSTVGQSAEIRGTVARLKEAESELAIAQAKFTDNSPNVIDLKNEINSLQKLLEQQASSVGGTKAVEVLRNNKSGVVQQELTSELIKWEASNFGLQRQLTSLQGLADSRQEKIKKVPEIEEKLSKLEREAQSYESSYEVLWKQLETVKIAESQDPGNVRVISNAVVPTTPVSSRAVGYLASGSLALLAAAGVIYLLEISDKSIKTIEEAKQLYGYTWLGVIPSTDHVNHLSLPEAEDSDPLIPKLVVRDYPSLPLSESYRMLQSNIKFLNSDRTAKTIVITSSATQEGKSAVAANLAAAMAQVGNKVLLVDANLHSPSQHRIWDRYNDSGLSNVIAEQLDPRMTIDEVMPNLDLLTSGTATLSPATLLDSQRMRMLMDYWSERYDFVIFDTPSLDMTADAPIMGRMADGVLLVVRPGFVERSQAAFTKDMLAQSGINMLGIIFNGITPQFDSTPFYYQALASQQSTQQNRLTDGTSSSKGELWDTISSMSKESKKSKLAANLGEEELQFAPIEKLESMVASLQQDLGDLDLLVREQEEELLNQRQKVKKLQRQANVATENERFYLENELSQEQERKRMLDETLVGQKRNLEKRREMLHQYQQVLETRKNASTQIL
ncbi:GumC family protein [Waterburya agarophytonicola]|nr:polysaccharide biosynthesis tyrosine autokinase [Waterburya agarophytonicola]